ncbi:MAG: hypothetical protein LBD77_01870, partial [Bifidobacteriaceae bacterium]|nr:hypothetical protein [Bifidobacteriaceae bacterium]
MVEPDSPGGDSEFAASQFTQIVGSTPFSEFSPYLDGPETVDDAALAAQAEWWERYVSVIAQCMAGQGFDYTPVEYPAVELPEYSSAFSQDFLSIPLLPAERVDVERLGYGTHGPLEVFDASDLAALMPDDPNQEYFDSLSAAAQLSYNEAYWGYASVEEAAYSSPAGCVGAAAAAAPEPVTSVSEFLDEFNDVVWVVGRLAYSEIFGDPRVASLAAEWDSCMRRGGIDVSSETDELAVDSDLAYANPNSAWYLALRTGADGVVGAGGRAVFEDSLRLDQRSLVGSPAEAEIALADFDCRAETDYEARFAAIQL